MPESVGRVRQFATRTLASWGAQQLEDDVRVVASELATNALLHARTEFTLALALDGDLLRVTLADGSAVQPRMRRFDSTESTTGRGLRMVAALAQAWGVEKDGLGKAVWCEFRIASASAAGADGAWQLRPRTADLDLDVEALLTLYGDDDGGAAPRPRLSSCSHSRARLVVRVVA
jgi:anti-sigma regulatory factor (Ser/Thr protein kinase)